MGNTVLAGREILWDSDEETRRIRDVIPGLQIPAAQFEGLIATCRDVGRKDRADRLIQLTLKRVVGGAMGAAPSGAAL